MPLQRDKLPRCPLHDAVSCCALQVCVADATVLKPWQLPPPEPCGLALPEPQACAQVEGYEVHVHDCNSMQPWTATPRARKAAEGTQAPGGKLAVLRWLSRPAPVAAVHAMSQAGPQAAGHVNLTTHTIRKFQWVYGSSRICPVPC